MIGSEPIALPLGDTPIFLDIFNWLDIWLDALQFLLYYKTSMPYISSVTKFITRGTTTRVRVRCLTAWRYPIVSYGIIISLYLFFVEIFTGIFQEMQKITKNLSR